MGAMGWLTISQLEVMQANTENMYHKQLVPLGVLSDIENNLQRLRQHTILLLTPLKPEEMKAVVDDAKRLDQDLADNSDKFAATIQSDEVRAEFSRFREEAKRWQEHRHNV